MSVSPAYTPASNGWIESFHRFLKSTITKHLKPGMEWDELVPWASAVYNWYPNAHTNQNPFFLMFARDPPVNLRLLLDRPPRPWGTENYMPDLEAYREMHHVAAMNIAMAHKNKPKRKYQQTPELQPGDLVLVRNHLAGSFEDRFHDNHRVLRVLGKTMVEVRDQHGKSHLYQIKNVKKISVAEKNHTTTARY